MHNDHPYLVALRRWIPKNKVGERDGLLDFQLRRIVEPLDRWNDIIMR